MDAKAYPILVVGLGNLLMGDDGLGVHAVRELERHPVRHATVIDIGTAVFHALHYLEAADRVLLIDAVQAGGTPGDIYQMDLRDAQQETKLQSVHAVGVCNLVELIPADHRPSMTVLGVEPESLEYRIGLSPRVQASLGDVTRIALDMLRSWSNRCEQNEQKTVAVPC